jgi:7,8-dihydropterin-6-yl-methyl-4-(beta-D-ribofuranosyl)aminobenzene 5'-phosphate synthase
MKVKILFEKEAVDDQYITGWGLSYLIQSHILFDTGENFDTLRHNARYMGVDLAQVEKVVITHDHWDHTGGLWDFLKINNHCVVYACSEFSMEFKERVKSFRIPLVEVTKSIAIDDNIYSTGQMQADYKGMKLVEQALVMDKGAELVLLCGCSHPGIVGMVERVKQEFSKGVTTVLGGFHLLNKEKRYIDYVVVKLRELGVQKVGASHCTGFNAQVLFRQVYGDNYIEVKAGKILMV